MTDNLDVFLDEEHVGVLKHVGVLIKTRRGARFAYDAGVVRDHLG